MIATTELINAYNFTPANMDTWIGLLQEQKIGLFIFRLNAFSEGLGTTSPGIATAKALIEKCNGAGIGVAIDLHTWCKLGKASWDAAFDDNVSAHTSNRAKYIAYVKNVLTAFAGSNVQAFMVMNEPQAQRASASENQFILDVIAAAKQVTNKPVSVRFMGSASPTTGHYAPELDDACDFICRNMYWVTSKNTYFDPREPDRTAEQAMLLAVASAHDAEKEFWLTEFGKSKSDREEQRSYVASVVAWAIDNGLDAAFCWASQPSLSGENYNIFTGWTPHPAFRELTGSEKPPPECFVDVDCIAKHGPPPTGKHWECWAGLCVLVDSPAEFWTLSIDHSGEGTTEPPTGTYEYGVSQSAVCNAVPAEGWVLDHWELDGKLPGATTLQVVVVPQEAGSAHHLMCYFAEYVPPPPPPPSCIIAFLLTAAGLSTALPFLRQFRSKLPKETVKGYYSISKILMKGVRWCDLI